MVLPGVAVDENNPNRIWISLGGVSNETTGIAESRVFRTDDASQGSSTVWIDMTTNDLSPLPVTCILLQPGSHRRVFIGTDGGIFYWEEIEQKWKCFTHDFPVTIVKDMKINSATGELYAATYGRGVWKAKLPCGSGWTNSNTVINNDEQWSSNKFVFGDVIIENGKTLTINNY